MGTPRITFIESDHQSMSPHRTLLKRKVSNKPQELTAVMSNKWLQEGELLLKPINFNPPSLSFHCVVRDQDVEALYNPTIGGNLMSNEFALAFLGSMTLTLTEQKLKRPSDSLLNSYGVLKTCYFGTVRFT